MPLQLTSPAFRPGEPIPAKYTCDGSDISPVLIWTTPPEGTAGLAVIMDDPDAPGGRFVHWVVYNLPRDLRLLQEGFPANASLPDGARQGLTDFNRTGYGGPCPPTGIHRYRFTLYALDAALEAPPRTGVQEVERAMQHHVLAQAQLIGLYQRRPQ